MAAKLKDKTDIDHHGPRYILIICHLPDPPTFSLPTTFNVRAPSRTVIAHYTLNGQMRSKAHAALTAPLVLRHTRIYKCVMKKFGFNGQMQSEPFLIVIYHSSLVRGAVNAARL
jgi:hypothetical protein